ncbi:hypothetical protein OOJ09_12735 [Mesorhizobium qingshengii]|uniref:Transposase n=1 Tax=Mesorhizobium qingshengii TaxID=1165689 RepID=A0ABT4QU14_9HYPH|nr:hypothetical protein [Mesorhizobium qingshengii]MCZ8545052.1 hypothetical protein [Mesorhizobium qingshengii]
MNIYVDEKTAKRMAVIAVERGEKPEVLAEYAVAEAALEYFRHRKDDPAKAVQP